jgi:TRAP-type C4-dicarboxylate transport system substrate-binding protein
MIEPWCAKIGKESGGRLKCQIYPAMQLGGTPPQLFDQVKDGVADIVWTVPGYQAGRFIVTETFELPFMIASAEKASPALWHFAMKHAQEEYKGVKPLIFHVIPGSQLHTASRQIRTLADFRGLKMRAPNRLATKLMTALGATPVPMPAPQIPESLSKGVVDGTVLPWEVIPSLKLHEIVKYHTETPAGTPFIATTAFVFAMNPAKYESLPAELKKVLDANSGPAASAWAGKVWDEQTGPARQYAIAHKNVFYTVPAQEVANWQKAAEPVTAEWIRDMGAKGFDGQKLIGEARALMK